MAQPPLTFLEQKWAAGYSNNLLISAATQKPERKQVPYLDYDFHRNVSRLGRRVLLSIGRFLYMNVPAVKAAIDEIARNAASTFIPQYYGRRKAIGNKIEAWLHEHHKICDYAGWPYNMDTYRRLLVVSIFRDGDMGTLLTQTPDGYPMLQIIPGHRIGSRNNANIYDTVVDDGPWKGFRIIDGVIVNSLGTAVAYRVLPENPWDYTNYVDISANDLFLSFIPRFPGQLRGMSEAGMGGVNWQDLDESRKYELVAQKLFAQRAFVEENEDGEPPPGGGVVSPIYGSDGKTVVGHTESYSDGSGMVQYFRAKTGSKLTAVEADRPSSNQQAFRDDVIRETLAGLGWSFDFSLNPTKVGGAMARVVIDKLNRMIDELCDQVVEPACRRYDGYAISKAMNLGLLPEDDDWYMLEYQRPARLTSDAKYDSDIAIQEIRSGISTRKKECAKRGDYFDDVDDQRFDETNSKLSDAAKLVDKYGEKYGLTLTAALTLLESPTPNGMPSAPGAGTGEPAKKKKSAAGEPDPNDDPAE